MTPPHKEISAFVSEQLDLHPSFNPKLIIHHQTTNYYFSRVTVSCFNMARFVTFNTTNITAGTTVGVKPAFKLQSHDGSCLSPVFPITNSCGFTAANKHKRFGCMKWKERQSIGLEEADFTHPTTAAAVTLPGFRGRTTINPAEAEHRNTRRKKKERE